MRVLIMFAGLVTFISVIYKWRYKIMSTLLAIRVLRKLAVSLSMHMPAMRNQILSAMFNRPVHSS